VSNNLQPPQSTTIPKRKADFWCRSPSYGRTTARREPRKPPAEPFSTRRGRRGQSLPPGRHAARPPPGSVQRFCKLISIMDSAAPTTRLKDAGEQGRSTPPEAAARTKTCPNRYHINRTPRNKRSRGTVERIRFWSADFRRGGPMCPPARVIGLAPPCLGTPPEERRNAGLHWDERVFTAFETRRSGKTNGPTPWAWCPLDHRSTKPPNPNRNRCIATNFSSVAGPQPCLTSMVVRRSKGAKLNELGNSHVSLRVADFRRE